jgi:hypothetical protein
VEDDDRFSEKIEVLLSDPVPVVSFTFGIPGPGVIAALRRAGTSAPFCYAPGRAVRHRRTRPPSPIHRGTEQWSPVLFTGRPARALRTS